MMTVLQIKAAVRARDSYRCVKCGMTDGAHCERYGRTLDVHRVVPGSLYSLESAITVCRSCHSKLPKRQVGQPELVYPPRVVLFLTPEGKELLEAESTLQGRPRGEIVADLIRATFSDVLAMIRRRRAVS